MGYYQPERGSHTRTQQPQAFADGHGRYTAVADTTKRAFASCFRRGMAVACSGRCIGNIFCATAACDEKSIEEGHSFGDPRSGPQIKGGGHQVQCGEINYPPQKIPPLKWPRKKEKGFRKYIF
jgi:hypothetical protein